MTASFWLLGLSTLISLPPGSAADAVTLKDGKVVLGQLLEWERRGPVLMVVRRDWAKVHLPEKLTNWARQEGPAVSRAANQRRGRLIAWRKDRGPLGAEGDRLTTWIDAESARLADPKILPASILMVVELNRFDVKSIDRKPRKLGRMLRLGWLSQLEDVESLPLAELEQALDGRGFSATVETPVSIDPLLPIPIETDLHWLVRRAATEVMNDPGGRLLRYQGMVMAEPAAGEAPPAAASLGAALGSLKGLLGEAPVDPLPGKLQELGRQGRTGAIVTRLELSPDFTSVVVESTLWIRSGDRWAASISKTGSARPDDLAANAGVGLADDPQVKAVFGLVEALGLGEIPSDLKRRSLNMGAATKLALGQVRTALDQELNATALSLEPRR